MTDILYTGGDSSRVTPGLWTLRVTFLDFRGEPHVGYTAPAAYEDAAILAGMAAHTEIQVRVPGLQPVYVRATRAQIVSYTD